MALRLLRQTFMPELGVVKLEVLLDDMPLDLRTCLAPTSRYLEQRCRSIYRGVRMYLTHGVLCRRPGSYRQDAHIDGGLCTMLVPLSGPVAPTLVWPPVGDWCCTESPPPDQRMTPWTPNEVQFIGAKRYHAGPGNRGVEPEFILYAQARPLV